MKPETTDKIYEAIILSLMMLLGLGVVASVGYRVVQLLAHV